MSTFGMVAFHCISLSLTLWAIAELHTADKLSSNCDRDSGSSASGQWQRGDGHCSLLLDVALSARAVSPGTRKPQSTEGSILK